MLWQQLKYSKLERSEQNMFLLNLSELETMLYAKYFMFLLCMYIMFEGKCLFHVLSELSFVLFYLTFSCD